MADIPDYVMIKIPGMGLGNNVKQGSRPVGSVWKTGRNGQLKVTNFSLMEHVKQGNMSPATKEDYDKYHNRKPDGPGPQVYAAEDVTPEVLAARQTLANAEAAAAAKATEEAEEADDAPEPAIIPEGGRGVTQIPDHTIVTDSEGIPRRTVPTENGVLKLSIDEYWQHCAQDGKKKKRVCPVTGKSFGQKSGLFYSGVEI